MRLSWYRNKEGIKLNPDAVVLGENGGRIKSHVLDKAHVLKHCPHCNELKDIHLFGIDKHTHDGRSCYCKECRRELQNARHD